MEGNAGPWSPERHALAALFPCCLTAAVSSDEEDRPKSDQQSDPSRNLIPGPEALHYQGLGNKLASAAFEEE
ncbi:hypothetical protein IMZ48_37745 [Candidatus Bathyarchaeota archaeon]|nr:hypothetical protein [Candidatus Bathyarchaeota archaeon]